MPKKLRDDILGVTFLSDGDGGWEAECQLCGGDVDLRVWADSVSDPVQEQLEVLRVVVDRLRSSSEAFRSFMADHLMELYPTWNDGGSANGGNHQGDDQHLAKRGLHGNRPQTHVSGGLRDGIQMQVIS